MALRGSVHLLQKRQKPITKLLRYGAKAVLSEVEVKISAPKAGTGSQRFVGSKSPAKALRALDSS
jgi:hypothetical protein